jgi:hypothetical protein
MTVFADTMLPNRKQQSTVCLGFCFAAKPLQRAERPWPESDITKLGEAEMN